MNNHPHTTAAANRLDDIARKVTLHPSDAIAVYAAAANDAASAAVYAALSIQPYITQDAARKYAAEAATAAAYAFAAGYMALKYAAEAAAEAPRYWPGLRDISSRANVARALLAQSGANVHNRNTTMTPQEYYKQASEAYDEAIAQMNTYGFRAARRLEKLARAAQRAAAAAEAAARESEQPADTRAALAAINTATAARRLAQRAR